MEQRSDVDSSFWIRCTGYTQSHEKFFTIGKKYEVRRGGYVSSDNGFVYHDSEMTPDSDPRHWFLSGWYRFEIVYEEVTIPDQPALSFEELMEFM